MATPARALADVLVAFAGDPNSEARFLTALASHLGLEGDDAESEAFAQLHRLTNECHRLVERLPFAEDYKEHARALLDPFDGFRNMSVAGHTVKQIWNPILHPSSFQNLKSLEMMLYPYFEVRVDVAVLEKARKELEEAAEQIKLSELPDALKKVIRQRIFQTIEAVNHFEFFGHEELQKRVDALVGQLAMQNQNAPTKVKRIFRRTVGAAAMALRAITLVGGATEGALLAVENTPLLLEHFGFGDEEATDLDGQSEVTPDADEGSSPETVVT